MSCGRPAARRSRRGGPADALRPGLLTVTISVGRAVLSLGRQVLCRLLSCHFGGGGREISMIARCLAVLGAAVLAIEACDPVGACEHIYEAPVLKIAQVIGSNSTSLASVTISDVVVDGQVVQDLSRLTVAPSFGVSIVNGEVRCQVACGFGVLEGTYEFTVKAAGYQDKRVSAAARYSVFEGGCPSRNSGSTEVSLSLDPAQ